jgi:hypothetical protein
MDKRTHADIDLGPDFAASISHSINTQTARRIKTVLLDRVAAEGGNPVDLLEYYRRKLAAEEAINAALRQENTALRESIRPVWFLCSLAAIAGGIVGMVIEHWEALVRY